MSTTEAVLAAIRCCVGPDRAITARQLIAALREQGIAVDDRDIRGIVAEADEPIVTGNAGYHWCDDPAELGETIGRLRSQAILMHARADRLAAWQQRLGETVSQLSFFDGRLSA